MKRWLRRIALWLGALTVVLSVAAVLLVRSSWFFERVRRFVVDTVETASGGRVDVQTFRFDWARMRAEVGGFTLHGTEPAGKPPLLQTRSVAVGLKIVSLLKKDVDIQYLEVNDPHIYLIVQPDGRTNIPEPKVKPLNSKHPLETIINLAVGRFDVRNGIVEVEAQGATPFSARGEHLSANLQYERLVPRYLANITVQPLTVRWPEFAPAPLGVALSLNLERNRIGINSAKLSSGGSHVDFSGAIENLDAPHGTFQYDAHVLVAEAAPVVHIEELRKGAIDVGGQAVWEGGSKISVTGNLRAQDMEFRDSTVYLGGFRLDGALTANPQGIDLTGIRLSGIIGGVGACPNSGPAAKLWPCPAARFPAEGRITKATLRGKDIELHNLDVSALGGNFRGEAKLRDLKRYSVTGDIAGFDAKRVVAVFNPEQLPWSATAAGPVTVDGVFKHKEELRLTGNLAITPAPTGAAVHGQIAAIYEAKTSVLDLGKSTLFLPSSRVDFSGAIPPVQGRELHARLETRDLNDVLPVLGIATASVPAKLEGGTAIFDGTITGTLDNPLIAGKLNATRYSIDGTPLDTLEGDAIATPAHVQMQNATISRGNLRAQFQGSLNMTQWKIGDDNNPITGSGTIHNAPVTELASLLKITGEIPTGTLSSTAQFGGTVGSPSVDGNVEILKGALREEPFDRFAAHVKWAARRAELTGGQLTAGAKVAQLSASFDALPDRLDSGRLHFDVATNVTPLEQIHTLVVDRPGVKGTVQVTAGGDLDIRPSQITIVALHADILGKSLQLNGQNFGDGRFTATSQGQLLNTHLESDFANSTIRGDGQWQLGGDNSGSANIHFAKLDFAQLRAWVAPSQSATTATATNRISGSAEGDLHVEGPLRKIESMKAELRIPKLEIGTPAGTVAGAGAIALTNSGPIVATMANSVVTVTSARLVGRSTDLSITGKIAIDQKNPLDLHVNGKADLAIVQTLDSGLVSSGTVIADAAIRGPFDAPQLNGRMQFQNAAFSLADFPNGISNANGVVIFTAERATIQSFTGETGGGTVELSGSAGYSTGPVVFQLRVNARQVRVRYPEGVSTVLNANLNLTGTPDRSMLDGNVTVLRTGINLQSDFSSIISKSAEPVRTPAAQTGLLGGLNFDVQITTDPDIQLQSALTEDLQADANLRLRGTVSNPAVVGRVTVTQGQVVFYGTKYTINQGTISFYNALKVEPILDVDLETKAHGIDITLTVAGPLNKLRLTPRSDPPLQFSEIVALLATGRTPTSDPTLLAQQSTAPQSWQQMGASALLGQAIANPVAGRLQRFFGVSKLRIDPTLPGVENNPQARLTLEQQVTPDITFTYITNVTNSNPQVVRMEWSFSKQWSVVALRDENGTFGVDFFFKKRF